MYYRLKNSRFHLGFFNYSIGIGIGYMHPRNMNSGDVRQNIFSIEHICQ